MSEYLTVPQVARAFGVRARTVRGWIQRKILAAKKDRVTGALYVPVSEVERRKSDLQDWQPGVKPVTFKERAEGGAVHEEKEGNDMAKGKKDAEQAQDHDEQDQGQQGKEERAPKRERQAPKREAPAKKKGGWGTVLDDEDDDTDEEE